DPSRGTAQDDIPRHATRVRAPLESNRIDVDRASPDHARMTRDELAKRIADVSLLRGEFTLRSGRKSNFYLDKYRFETQPDVLTALGKLLAERVTSKVDRIAGAELGAVPLAVVTAIAAGKPC